jgi:hypothetical protein
MQGTAERGFCCPLSTKTLSAALHDVAAYGGLKTRCYSRETTTDSISVFEKKKLERLPYTSLRHFGTYGKKRSSVLQ